MEQDKEINQALQLLTSQYNKRKQLKSGNLNHSEIYSDSQISARPQTQQQMHRKKNSEIFGRQQYEQIKRQFMSNQLNGIIYDQQRDEKSQRQKQQYDYNIPVSFSRKNSQSTNVASKEISNFKSANTLRNSVLSFRFSSDQRFRMPNKPDSKNILNQPDWTVQSRYHLHKKNTHYNLQQGPSFGHGKRELFRLLLKERKLLPPPNNYKIFSQFNQVKKPFADENRCTFGLSYDNYRGTSDFEIQRGLKMSTKKDVPPPNQYSPKKAQSKSPAFTMKERAKTCYFDPGREVLSKPAPNKYNPSDDKIKSQRYSEIALGYGDKMLGHYAITKRQKTPGPGQYKYEDHSDMSPRSRKSHRSHLNSMDLRPQARECSFALAHSGDPFTVQGAIDKSPKITTPISYQSMFDRETELSFYNRQSNKIHDKNLQYASSRYDPQTSQGSRPHRRQQSFSAYSQIYSNVGVI